MTTTTHIVRLDPDGVLRLTLPLDPALAGREVQITVTPKLSSTDEEYCANLLALAGRWQGDIEYPEDLSPRDFSRVPGLALEDWTASP